MTRSDAKPVAARPRILMPLLSRASFVETDIRLLSEAYDVRALECRSVRGLLRSCVAAITADCVYCWFASLWFAPVIAIARLFGHPVVVVCGGYDVARLPEIDYGNMRLPVARLVARFIFRGASVALPFSESAHREARENVGVRADTLRMIYLGVSDMAGDTSVARPKRPVVLTVSNIDHSTLTRKGLLTVAAVSRLMPDVQFVMAGRGDPAALLRLQQAVGPNVRLAGHVDDETLRHLMQTSKVIFQPSRHEGFGMSVAEAMLFGAIPVVSPRYSLPEIVGDTGFFGDPDDPASFVGALHSALAAPPSAGAAARGRILREFPLQRRRSELLAVMKSICPIG